jgi:hypothetical protein
MFPFIVAAYFARLGKLRFIIVPSALGWSGPSWLWVRSVSSPDHIAALAIIVWRALKSRNTLKVPRQAESKTVPSFL